MGLVIGCFGPHRMNVSLIAPATCETRDEESHISLRSIFHPRENGEIVFPPLHRKRNRWGGSSYVGMGGGKGTVTPLLKGKVRIPPPAGHFIDPTLFQEIFLLTPLLSQEKFSHTASRNHKKMCLQVAKLHIFFNKFQKLF